MLLRLLLTTTLALTAFAATAQTPVEPFQAGTHYFPIVPAQPVPGDGKIEVIEAFSFACGACAAFEPHVAKWLKTKPADVRFDLLPAQYNTTWEMFARGYYAAAALGLDKKGHQAVFDAVHVKRSVKTLDDLAKVYAQFGRSEADFLAAAKSFSVDAKLKRAKTVFPRYHIDGTPNVIVAGKYRVTGNSAGGQNRIFDVVDFLVAKERAAKLAPAPAAAPANG